MINTISNHLQASLLEKGLISLQPQSIDITQLVDQAIRNNLIAARLKSITIHANLKRFPTISGDYFRLMEVMDQLIQNAIHYTPEGKEIHLEMYKTNNSIFVAITDQGCGFLPLEKERLFQRFVRLNKRNSSNEDTVGLGLAISKRILELHGGSISAVSPGTGQGATFTIELPL